MVNNNDNNSYVGAPYNFIPFYSNVVDVDKKQMETHGIVKDELLTGEIHYSVEAKTPIYISDGKKKGSKDIASFVRNERGEYIIPGSSMRGLIRSNAQVLGLSSFDNDIDNYNLMYRNVAAGAEKIRYNNILGSKPVNVGEGKTLGVLTNVKAGYIAKKENNYVIYMTAIDKIKGLNEMNYYVLSERNIVKDIISGKTSFSFFKEHPECLQHDMKTEFRKEKSKGRIRYIGKPNTLYKEGCHKISYDVADLRRIVAVDNPGQCSKEGYLVCSGQMQEKKAKYIIPCIDKTKDCIVIPKEDVEAFKIDYNRKKNTLRGNKNFFALPDNEDDIKPVFYINLKGRLYFGFTPRLRLFYDHKIKDGFLQKTPDFDYAKSLFGTINDKVGYKSKISFTDAVLEGEAIKANEMKVIQGEPKPTSYLDYLKQKDGTTTYNQDGFELRGMKQYWLHNDIYKYKYTVNNEKVFTHMRPLEKGSRFNGTVRFQNLTKAELGLLLWSIRLEKDSLMNMGKGKAFGYGVIEVSDIKVDIFDTSKAYDLSQMIDFSPMKEMKLEEYITSYKTEINSRIKEGDIDKLESIQTFFKMHNAKLIPDNDNIRYMTIDKPKCEYQNRVRDKKALPFVNEVISSNKRTVTNNVVKPKKKVSVGGIYEAEVKGHEGKKIKFFFGGNYEKVSVDCISGISDLNKKNMKEKLPVGTKVSLKCLESGDNPRYEIMNFLR